MPFREYLYMLELKDIVEHRRMLAQMQVSAYPHTKAESAKRFHRKVSRKAFPQTSDNTTSNEAAFAQFKRMTRNV